MRFGALPLLICVLLCVPSMARADAASEAQLQYELGAELYKQKRYTEAIDRFIASQRLAPNPNVVLNIVQTFDFLDRKADAYNWNETYLTMVPAGPQRDAGVERRDALAREVAVVDVKTEPPGAQLFVDREELGSLGNAPRRLAVTAGKHLVKARLDRHDDAAATVEATLGQTVEVRLVLPVHRGRLQVRGTPVGASVRLEGEAQELGKMPFSTDLPLGEYRIVVSRAGHQEQILVARISKGGDTVLTPSLKRLAAETSVLTVRGNAPGAEVWLDGRRAGEAPLTLQGVEPGRRRIEVHAPAREPWQNVVLFEPGAATRIDYELVDPSDRAWPGWRWVGYGTGGALLAGGAVTGLIARGTKSDFDREPSTATLDRLHAQNTTADVLMASGLVVLVATAVWDLALRSPDPRSSGRVSIER